MDKQHANTLRIALISCLIVVIMLVAGTTWMGSRTTADTEEAVHSVSLLYLDELAGRRERVVAANLASSVRNLKVAIGLMNDEDLSDIEHLQQYQARMRQLYDIEKFAFVDTNGLIYTADGTQTNIDDYSFDYKDLNDYDISLREDNDGNKKVIIAAPVDNLTLGDESLVACFMEIDMDRMLQGVSMQPDEENTTFCNIYTTDGVALTDMVLGGLASEDNLLDALKNADFEDGSSYEQIINDFEKGQEGVVSFTYNGIQETLAYIPIEGTDWLLTYLIRESVISENIGSITNGIVQRSLLQAILIALVLLAMFVFLIAQMRKNAQLALEKETADVEMRARHEELEQRLALQEQLLEQERRREQQDKMITALSSDYWSVYYLELDTNEGICYQEHSDLDGAGLKVGEHFKFMESVTAYANAYVTDQYRDEFMHFVQPETIRKGLANNKVISYRYLVRRHGQESYEMVRFAGVRHPGDRDDGIVHAVGACFVNVDDETRRDLEQQQALSDALAAAEEASKAKTTFLSNMSHEIRTPMNAIIGLDNIALASDELTPQTREYLEKIDNSAHHLLSLINDILDMSRIESGRMTLKNEEFSFSELVEQVNTIFSGQCEDKGLTYSCYIHGELEDYYIGDSIKLRQALINILGNAVKFTPEGGCVTFDITQTAQFDGKSTLEFVIADTGIGIREEYLPHIFDTFSQEDSSFTNKYGSSGLGLAITKSIVEMMNGSIEVKSTKGEGSTFIFTVTLMDADNSIDHSGIVDLEPHEMSVLVVDDDPIACEHARLVLEKIGIAAEIAESGTRAIEMVKLRHARRDPYNLILVDWKMPEMNGIETTRRIRAITGDSSAIVILTAYRWDDVLEEALEAGVDSFLAKPLFATNVMDEFNAALKKKSLELARKRAAVDLEGRRVLLAEDVDINAEILQMILEMRGVVSERAVNGKVAVNMFAEHEPGYYDVILMDIRMPEMDGLEAAETIRAMTRPDAQEIPIIALTANAFDEDVQRSLQAGLNAHLTKPIQPDSLFETLEGFLR